VALRIALFLFALSCAPAWGEDEYPVESAKRLVETTCTMCHELSNLDGKQWTKAQWRDKVGEMLQEQPDVTRPERDAIVYYLAKNFGKPGVKPPVNVNSAPAKDFETELGLSASEAAAIVQHRSANGKFRTLDDVKKLAGVDAAKVETKKDLIEF
jgi:competence protein ComEA